MQSYPILYYYILPETFQKFSMTVNLGDFWKYSYLELNNVYFIVLQNNIRRKRTPKLFFVM